MTDKKFTDEEIKKGLEICTTHGGCVTSGCPFHSDYDGCIDDVMDAALDLINRQQAEIERLTVNMNAFGLGMKRAAERADTARAEAIKEFAERLKDKVTYHEDECGEFAPWVDCRDITALVKEMTGETKPEKCDCFCEEQRIKGWLDGNTPITEPITVCNGTRERDECTCGGDKSKCDFYAKDYSYGY